MNVKPDVDSPQSFIDRMSNHHDSVLPMHSPKLSLFSGRENFISALAL
jgi:uncharacterized protein (DUF305 family)